MNDTWNPSQYGKFANERKQPFYDLLKLVEDKKGVSIIDLGCGTGELTEELHSLFDSPYTLGIDASSSMLQKASKFQANGLEFAQANIETFSPNRTFDLVFSNAALQWVPDHPHLFKHLFTLMSKDSQLAIQIPCNNDYPTHVIAKELSQEAPFKEYFHEARTFYTLTPEQYVDILKEGGMKKEVVKLQIYPHVLESTASVIEWVKGTLLTFYQSHLPPDVFQKFLERYTREVYAYFGDQSPFFFQFKRMLIWAKKG